MCVIHLKISPELQATQLTHCPEAANSTNISKEYLGTAAAVAQTRHANER